MFEYGNQPYNEINFLNLFMFYRVNKIGDLDNFINVCFDSLRSEDHFYFYLYAKFRFYSEKPDIVNFKETTINFLDKNTEFLSYKNRSHKIHSTLLLLNNFPTPLSQIEKNKIQLFALGYIHSIMSDYICYSDYCNWIVAHRLLLQISVDEFLLRVIKMFEKVKKETENQFELNLQNKVYLIDPLNFDLTKNPLDY